MSKRGKQPGLSKLEHLIRKARIVDLDLEGLHDYEIAKETGVSVSYVEKVLKEARHAWEQKPAADKGAEQQRRLDEIRIIRREYWAAWRRSQGQREVTETEKTDQEGEARKKAKIRREGRDGAAAFLAGVQWCVEQECRILGLYAPSRQEVSGPKGGPIPMSVADEKRELAQTMLARLLQDGRTYEQAKGELQALGIPEEFLAHGV